MSEQKTNEKKEFNFKVPFEVKITSEMLDNILTTAFEGGSNYWANYDYVNEVEIYEDYNALDLTDFYSWEIVIYQYGEINFQQYDLDTQEQLELSVLDRNSLFKGAEIMAKDYPRHFEDWINGDWDSITADVYLQCCLFGDIIYG